MNDAEEEDFVGSLQALLVRYGFSIIQIGYYHYLKDDEGVVHCIDDFFKQMPMLIDKV